MTQEPKPVGFLFMDASFLIHLFRSVYLIAIAMWVGIICFFSFAIAPIIFKVLKLEDAGRFVRTLFPRYYMWLITLSTLALPAAIGPALAAPGERGVMIAVRALLILSCVITLIYCSESLTPAINLARDAGSEGKAKFDALHKRSVRLNSVVLLVGVVLLLEFAFRPASQSGGMVEPTPIDRFESDMKRYKESLEKEQRSDEKAAGSKIRKSKGSRQPLSWGGKDSPDSTLAGDRDCRVG